MSLAARSVSYLSWTTTLSIYVNPISRVITSFDLHRMVFFFLASLACAFICDLRLPFDGLTLLAVRFVVFLGTMIYAFAVLFRYPIFDSVEIASRDAMIKAFEDVLAKSRVDHEKEISRLQKAVRQKNAASTSLEDQAPGISELNRRVAQSEIKIAEPDALLKQKNTEIKGLKSILAEKERVFDKTVCEHEKKERELANKHWEYIDSLRRSHGTSTAMFDSTIACKENEIAKLKEQLESAKSLLTQTWFTWFINVLLRAGIDLIGLFCLEFVVQLAEKAGVLVAAPVTAPVVTPVAEKSGWGRLFNPA
ncbi:hypothetical protein IWZ00DRAFT_484221 [Phyllosticta capitalensis]